jgi:hypothetical protein
MLSSRVQTFNGQVISSFSYRGSESFTLGEPPLKFRNWNFEIGGTLKPQDFVSVAATRNTIPLFGDYTVLAIQRTGMRESPKPAGLFVPILGLIFGGVCMEDLFQHHATVGVVVERTLGIILGVRFAIYLYLVPIACRVLRSLPTRA